MEIICRILQQHPLSSTEYTDRQGQQKTFNAIGFELVPAVKTSRQQDKTSRQQDKIKLFMKTIRNNGKELYPKIRINFLGIGV